MATVIDGKKAAAEVLAGVKAKAEALRAGGTPPGLATVLVGDDPASHVYVGQKIKKSEECGIVSLHRALPASTSQATLLSVVSELNNDPRVHAILVQLPLPSHLDAESVVQSIRPEKDADGLHPLNQGIMGRMKSWTDILSSGVPLPCTPAGVIDLLLREKIDVAGRLAVVVGRSTLVGKPVAQMLLSLDATVVMAHSRTKNLDQVCRQADILIAALGRPEFIKENFVKPGAVVIDVGISRTQAGLRGDVDFPAVSAVASRLTPVPGGVGPMTVAMLLRNTVRAAEKASRP